MNTVSPVTPHPYQVGGSLPIDAPSYVKRQADQDLYEGLKAGDFCYVLTCRQMGKSSLRVQTMHRLQEEGFACASIDVTAIGSDITPEQWYAGIIDSIASSLELYDTFDLEEWWSSNELLSYVQRFSKFFEEVLLQSISQNIVIFVDEIDSILGLNFNTDDFFAVIRDCYNNRADKPEFCRLTFTLIGVAQPLDLIQDKRRTPFNIGRGIQLTNFQIEAAQPLASGLAVKTNNPQTLLQEILSWTGGQPLLTQRICKLAVTAESSPAEGQDAAWLAQLVKTKVIENWEAQDEPTHLRTIQDRILRNSQADCLLELYQQVLEHKELATDGSPNESILQLTGLVIQQQGKLKVYNPVYEAVFNQTWLNKTLSTLRPYGEVLKAWFDSGCQDSSRLLRGKALQEAQIWASNKNLSIEDYQFLAASEKFHLQEFQKLAEAEQTKAALAAQQQANQILAEAAQRARRRLRFSLMILIASIVLSATTVWITYRYAMKSARIGDTRAKAALSNAEFASQRPFDALLLALQAARQLENIDPIPADLQTEVQFALQQAFYNTRERHRFDGQDGHTARVLGVDVSAQGLIASASTDNTVKLWQPNGELLQTLRGHQGTVLSTSFSPDGQILASSSTDGTVKLWTTNGQLLSTIEIGRSAVLAVDFSPDGQTLVVGESGGSVSLWNRKGEFLDREADVHPGGVLSAQFSPGGSHIVSGGDDGTIRLWRVEQTPAVGIGDRPITLPTNQPNASVFSVVFSSDGQLIASAHKDGTAKIWNLDGELLGSLPPQRKPIRTVQFSPDGSSLLTAGDDYTISLWKMTQQAEQIQLVLLTHLRGHTNTVSALSFSPDGQTIISTSWDTTVRLWSQQGVLLDLFEGHTKPIWAVEFSPDGEMLASAGEDFAIHLWTLDGSPRLVLNQQAHDNFIFDISFSPDSQLIASASADQTIKLWDLTGKAMPPLNDTEMDEGAYLSVSFSPDGQLIAAGNTDGFVRLWNRNGQFVRRFRAHNQRVWGVAFSPDGQTLASASIDNTVKLWDLSGHQLHELIGHTSEVLGVSFSPDGQILASASEDGTIRLWSREGQPIGEPLIGHQQAVWRVRFSPDGKTLASASEDRTIKLWNLDGELLKTLVGHTDQVKDVSFSSDGRMLASASFDQTVKLWNSEVMNFDGLIQQSCGWVKDYLETQSNENSAGRQSASQSFYLRSKPLFDCFT